MLALVSGLTLEKSSGDFVNGKVVGVSPDLYMKGCIEEVSDGIKVIKTLTSCFYQLNLSQISLALILRKVKEYECFMFRQTYTYCIFISYSQLNSSYTCDQAVFPFSL